MRAFFKTILRVSATALTVGCGGGNGALTDEPVASLSSAITTNVGQPVTQMASSYLHSCALIAAGKVGCWGNDIFRMFGNGPSTWAEWGQVQFLPGVSDAQAISTGGNRTSSDSSRSHTCVLRSAGKVSCWALAPIGAYSTEQFDVINVPYAIGATIPAAKLPTDYSYSDLSNMVSITSAQSISCGLHNSGKILCWGRRGYTYTPYGSRRVAFAYELPGISNPTSYSLGPYGNRFCAVLPGGTYSCYALKDLVTVPWTDNPDVSGPGATLTDVQQIVVGEGHACARLGSGAVKCWGSQADGQLGRGAYWGYRDNPVPAPALVTGLSDVAALATGNDHTCALKKDGTVWCWGSVAAPGRTQHTALAPEQMTGVPAATQIFAGGGSTCALFAGGAGRCWATAPLDQLLTP